MNINEIAQAVQKVMLQCQLTAMGVMLDYLNDTHQLADLRDKLSSLPQEIRISRKTINSQRSQLRNLIREIKDKEVLLKSTENTLLLMLTAETNGNGKPVYSNDKARQAELSNRKQTDHEYKTLDAKVRALRDQVDDLENIVAMNEADLEKLQNTFTAVTKQTGLVTQEIYLSAVAMAAGNQIQQLFGAGTGVRMGGFTESKQPEAEAAGWDA